LLAAFMHLSLAVPTAHTSWHSHIIDYGASELQQTTLRNSAEVVVISDARMCMHKHVYNLGDVLKE
jgi:hypothetical protein